ncbi:SEC14-like protein 2 [Nephila pilipes]|uniref:SEC14-like protein 2 n=1 Tax=Nephila pilipes TaxID=299642 RepID=A0A8X6J111_NEPPI|nr:SEC14-like protein 2 [Nephila pilipes]
MSWPNNITPEENKVIEQLKKRTINDLTPKLLEDESLFYRFCKARDFVLEDAEAMLRKHLVWRKELRIDTILTEHKPLEVFNYAATSFIGFDKEGLLVRYFDFGNADFKGLFNSAKKNDVLLFSIVTFEQDIELMKEHSKKLGKPITQAIHIINFENLTFSQATNKKALEVGMLYMKTFQDNYPERVKFLYHINASYYYTLTMAVVRTVIASPVFQKIKVFGSEGWKEDFLELIDADVLPAFLGGNRTDPDGDPMCRSFICHGGKIPEKYYLSNYEKKLSKAEGVEKFTVTRFSKQERKFEIKHIGSDLEWEFETKNKDIGFALYFKDKESSKESKGIELVPKQRIDTCYEPEKGLFKCQKVGTYTLVFDNSYSWIHSKEVYFRARIKIPKDDENHQ